MFIQYLILHNLDSVDSLYVNDTLAIMLESKSSHDVSYMNVKPCIPVAEFANFVAKMKGGTGFRTEYESLPLIDDFASTSAAKLNARKNRYDRILPYDHSRVIICGDSSDYINASFINDYKGQKGYIAAQGPMAGTIGDFWKMVWEQKSSVIVMLTKLEEGGKLKCDKYWNDEMNQRIQLNSGVTLALEERKVFSEYVLRTFSIQNVSYNHVHTSTTEHSVCCSLLALC
jgi:protein tyrosine phosphatase